MADQTAPARRQSDGQMSLTATAATSFGAAGGGTVVIWLSACIQAGHFIAPSNEAALFMAACCAPIVHALGRVIIHWLNRLGGAADNGGGA